MAKIGRQSPRQLIAPTDDIVLGNRDHQLHCSVSHSALYARPASAASRAACGVDSFKVSRRAWCQQRQSASRDSDSKVPAVVAEQVARAIGNPVFGSLAARKKV